MVPDGTLEVAVDHLLEDISTKVLGKRKLMNGDSVTVKNGVVFSCDVFNRLRQGEWFDAWNYDGYRDTRQASLRQIWL